MKNYIEISKDEMLKELRLECVGLKQFDLEELQKNDPALASIVECIRDGLKARGLFN